MSSEQFTQEIARINNKIDTLTNVVSGLVTLVKFSNSNSEPDQVQKPIFEDINEAIQSQKSKLITIKDYYPGTNMLKRVYTIHSETNLETSEEDKPSSVCFTKEGKIKEETWKKYGNYFRENDLPNHIGYDSKGIKMCEAWYSGPTICAYMNRQNDPCLIDYYPTGEVKAKLYNRDDKTLPIRQHYEITPYHHLSKNTWEISVKSNNINEPMYEIYNHLGNLVKRRYSFKNTKGLPTKQVWQPKGDRLIKEVWINDRIKHRNPNEGPAEILYDTDGKVFAKKYYSNGNLIKYEI